MPPKFVHGFLGTDGFATTGGSAPASHSMNGSK